MTGHVLCHVLWPGPLDNHSIGSGPLCGINHSASAETQTLSTRSLVAVMAPNFLNWMQWHLYMELTISGSLDLRDFLLACDQSDKLAGRVHIKQKKFALQYTIQ